MNRVQFLEYILKALKHTVDTWIWKIIFGTSIPSFLSSIFVFGNLIKERWGIPVFNSIVVIFIIIVILFLFRFFDNLITSISEHYKRRFEEAVLMGVNERLKEIEKVKVQNDSLILLKQSFVQIRQIDTSDKAKFTNSLIQLCTVIKAYFDKITNSNCCVSIKVPVEDEQCHGIWNKYVRNICRDVKHQLKRETMAYTQKNHTIIENTPYTHIIQNLIKGDLSKFYYINEDIPNTKGDSYKNSSYDTYHNQKLPYKSELVVPILPNYIESKLNFGGFLCVDCEIPHSFDSNSEVLLLQIIANDIFDVVTSLNTTIIIEKTEEHLLEI